MLMRVLRILAFTLVVLATSTAAFSQVRISVAFGPPALPIYEQPLCPGDGYLWVPGYWAWDDIDDDYYWVPGVWVLAPQVGFLWTPPYWAWTDGAFVFYEGYWGPHVGFYGGIVYGFGYFGFGFVGGRWDGGHFFYNRSVLNVNVVNVHNVYNETVINNNVTVNRVSYNGGPGGIEARPRSEDEVAARERHVPPVAIQAKHVQAARSQPELRASVNRGKPPIAAAARPAEFRGRSVVAAKEAGAPYNPPANRRSAQPHGDKVVHPKELPPLERPAAPNSGDAKRDRKYQQEQEKLFAKQDQERQKLQQKQEQEHQRLERQNAAESRKQQVEQRHQQQTEQLQQRHTQQQQHLQDREKPSKQK
jgi:YXWGXW repeat-containing protein